MKIDELDINVEEAKSKLALAGEETEYAIDLDKLPEVKHNWVKRGIKVSCEGANHPHHSHFLVKK
jgi:hypothetical protein